MRMPESLATLLEQGIIDQVLRPLMSGKEAQVYLVRSAGEERVAKVYKDAQVRSFKHRIAYTEGRQVRSSRDRRAMSKHSAHGRAREEAAWRSTEVDMIRRLHAAGVRVPAPFHFVEGVLVMELVKDSDGNPAPRLGDVRLGRDEAAAIFDRLIREVVRMLCAGVVHGDLSDFNVLLGADGPVLIDFPQALDASSNQNTRAILLRDVANLDHFLARSVPGAERRPFAEEIWALYERGDLRPDTPLSGHFAADRSVTDVGALLKDLDQVRRNEERRREVRGLPPLRPQPGTAAGFGRPARPEPGGSPARAGRGAGPGGGTVRGTRPAPSGVTPGTGSRRPDRAPRW
jgi:RIO kinase 1